MPSLRVVVTGASGFLGRNVLLQLKTAPNIEIVAVTRKKISGWVQVSNYSEAPTGDVLIHLGENSDRNQVAVAGESYAEESYRTIESLLRKKFRRVVYVSTSLLYGDADTQPHVPTDAVKPMDPYTNAKLRAESVVLRESGGVVVRLANLYGPCMSKNNVLSNILRQISGAGPIEVMDEKPIRDFIWVEDAAEGVVKIALSKLPATSLLKIFNLGTNVGTSVGTLARTALEISGKPDRGVLSTMQSAHESCLVLDYSETTKACGWSPKTSIRDGLTSMLLASATI